MMESWKELCEKNNFGAVTPWLKGMREQGTLRSALVEECWAEALRAEAVLVCSALHQEAQWLSDSPGTRAIFQTEIIKATSATQNRWSKGVLRGFCRLDGGGLGRASPSLGARGPGH